MKMTTRPNNRRTLQTPASNRKEHRGGNWPGWGWGTKAREESKWGRSAGKRGSKRGQKPGYGEGRQRNDRQGVCVAGRRPFGEANGNKLTGTSSETDPTPRQAGEAGKKHAITQPYHSAPPKVPPPPAHTQGVTMGGWGYRGRWPPGGGGQLPVGAK